MLKQSKLLVLILPFLVFLSCAKKKKTKKKSTKENVDLTNWKKPDKLTLQNLEKLARRVKDAGDHTLKELSNKGFCTLALLAAWERVIRSAKRTRGKKGKQEMKHFFTVLEKKLPISPPSIWKDRISSVNLGWRKKQINSFGSKKPDTVKTEDTEWAARIEEIGEKIKLYFKDRTLVAPEKITTGGEHAKKLDVRNLSIVVIYGSSRIGSEIFAVNSKGKNLWYRELIELGNEHIINQGKSWHEIFLKQNGDSIYVFGISASVAYVDVFKIKTGERTCSFSTVYSDFRD